MKNLPRTHTNKAVNKETVVRTSAISENAAEATVSKRPELQRQHPVPHRQVCSWILLNGSMIGGDHLAVDGRKGSIQDRWLRQGRSTGGTVATERESCPVSHRNSLFLNSVSSHAKLGREQGLP